MKPLPLLVWLAVGVITIHAAAPRVKVEAYPRIAMAPAALKLTARVDPHPDNRMLRIVLDCERFYAASEIQLDGADAARTHQLPIIEGVPAGGCEVTAAVTDNRGKVLTSLAVTVLVAGEPEPEREGPS